MQTGSAMIFRRSSASGPASKPISEDEERQSMPTKTLSAVKNQTTNIETAPGPDWWSDRYSILLLVALYTAQGLPVGLVFGSIPFLLKERGSSYADLAKFSLASLPYSIKLFIAPIVDSLYSPTFGRRKSWIVPVQFVISCVSLLLASHVQQWVQSGDVNRLMPVFMLLMGLASTQDIAVDGWSLTMLKKENVSFASACQSFGLSIGFFGTYTIYLAFSNADFCDEYVRPLFRSSNSGALVDLASAFRLMGAFFLFLTVYVAWGKREAVDDFQAKKADLVTGSDEAFRSESLLGDKDSGDIENSRACRKKNLYDSISSTYSDMFLVVRLSAVKSLVLCLLIAKFGMSAYDNVFSLKMVEFGFSKEKMASIAVLQAPFTLIGTIFAGRWIAKRSSIHVYLAGWALRFLLSLTGPLCVALLKQQGGTAKPWLYALVLTTSVAYSIASECLMFVGMGAFFLTLTATSVHVAGSYLTLLNTASNMGGIWHKAIILWLVDHLTFRENCALSKEDLKNGVQCPVSIDGFYAISTALIPIAILCGIHIFRTVPRIYALPDSSWRAGR